MGQTWYLHKISFRWGNENPQLLDEVKIGATFLNLCDFIWFITVSEP